MAAPIKAFSSGKAVYIAHKMGDTGAMEDVVDTFDKRSSFSHGYRLLLQTENETLGTQPCFGSV